MEGDFRNGQRLLAVSFFLLLLSLVLPTWAISYSTDSGFQYEDLVVSPFRPEAPSSTVWAPIATGIAWGLAALTIFVTVASREVYTEQSRAAKWALRSGLLMILGLAFIAFWPNGVSHFWAKSQFVIAGSDSLFTQTVRPSYGFWTALTSIGCIIASFWFLPKPVGSSGGMKPLVLSERDYKLLTLFTKIAGIFLFASGTIQIADWGRVGLGLILVLVGIVVTMAPVPMTVVRPDTIDDDEDLFTVNE